MLRTGEAVRVFSFCLEPNSINSVLVILCEYVSDQPFADIYKVFLQTGLNDIHIFISVGKMRVIGIHSRIRISQAIW